MTSKILTQIIICLTVAVAILVPALTLFNWGDYLYCCLDAPANQKMMIEVLILAAIIAVISLLVRQRKPRLICFGALALIFSYIHSMLLPVAVAGVYFLAVVSIGNMVTGIAAVIILEGILSLFGWGTPTILGIAVLIVAILYTIYRILYKKDRIFNFQLPEETAKWQLLVNAVVLLVVLVQIGRASVAVKDFDSLWYGLRSEHVLAPGGSIFENLGLVGMVYTYSKGYEILTLPLCAFRSYAYIPVFNTCLFIAGLAVTYRIVLSLCRRPTLSQEHESKAGKYAGMAVIITAVIPAIVNMCVSAKPDMITWILQLVMIERFFVFVRMRNGKARLGLFLEILAAYLLSLTMKPTAVILSTAVAGMMLIWWIVDMIVGKDDADDKSSDNQSSYSQSSYNQSSSDQSLAVTAVISAVAAFLSLCVVWGRTIMLTGVPFTSVFTGLLTALGLKLKYPFAATDITTRYKGDSIVKLVGKRTARMLLSPEGNDMNHVSIAWGGSIMLVLAVVIIICIIVLISASSKKKDSEEAGTVKEKADSRIWTAAATVFIPYAIVCAVTLAMLSQVDGNYYMTLYSMVIITAMWLAAEVIMRTHSSGEKTPVAIAVAATAIIAFQFFIVLLTNWASAPGFTPIAFNKLYYDNENDNRIRMTSQATPESIAEGTTIYDVLAAQPEARVMAIGEYPFCVQLGCVAQSYGDMTYPWGNPQLENSTDEFIDFLHFAGVDYIFVDGEYINRDECKWRRGMLEEMDERGLLQDYLYEGNNYLVRVK